MEAEAVSTARPAAEAAALSAAFERLFLQEYGRVAGIAYRVLGDAHAAEDVAQEVFLSFHRRHRPDTPFAPAWLHAAAAHLALNAARTSRRRDRRETLVAPRDADRVADPEQEALAAEERLEVRSALARLPRDGASLLVLRYGGLTYAEIAAALNVKADQVGTRLRRAQAAFKKEVLRGPR